MVAARVMSILAALVVLLGTVASAQFGPPPVRSPEVNADSTVTFRFVAPNAKAVNVRGITREPLAMTKDGTGVWIATSTTLKPDLYTYSFDVDGLSTVDPSNTRFSSPYRRIGQNTVLVPGDMPWSPLPNVPRGVVSQHVFQSKLANDERDFYVYTPPNYDAKRSESYPVLYLHHGWQQDTRAWLDDGAANVTLDTLINQGKAVPMVLVMPHAYGTAAGPVDIDHLDMLPTYTRILLEEVIPQVEKQYNVSTERNGRAMAGLSMGGAESMHTGLNHLETFAWLGSFSGAFNTWPLTRPATRGRGFSLAERCAIGPCTHGTTGTTYRHTTARVEVGEPSVRRIIMPMIAMKNMVTKKAIFTGCGLILNTL